jgi:carbon-monoxide dehydrogenase small subunit
LTVNGREHSVTAHPLARLLDVLRGPLGLTGTKEGCGEGECGACTVLMEGLPVLACLVPLGHAEGKQITTIEGLGREDDLHPLQRAFHEEGGAQCGICTPGMILAAAYYLEHPEAAEDAGEALAGNQCRCTGYVRIFAALKSAARLPR